MTTPEFNSSKDISVPDPIKEGSYKNKILVNGVEIEWDTTKGTCTFRGIPVAMMWIDSTLAGLMAGVAAMVGPERFYLALQSEGRKNVESDWLLISSFPDFRDGFAALNLNAAVAAWGDWQLHVYDPEKKLCIFRAYNNWEGLYQKALGVCWGSGMLAGKLSGICSKLFDTNCWATQTSFVAKGAAFDEFQVIPSDRNIEDEIEKRLSTDTVTRTDMAIELKRLKETEASLRQEISECKRTKDDRFSHLRFMENLDKVNQAIQGSNDLHQMMSDTLKTVLSIFDCDRTWLFYPCDPNALSFRVPMEITKPEYPGAGILNVDVPMPPDMAQNLREALETDGPVTYTAGSEKPVNKVSAELFGVKSMMIVSLYPKSGKPWAFGLHQCTYPRVWISEEVTLFQEISRRLADALSSVLSHRDLQESEAKYRRIVDTTTEGIWGVGPDMMTTFVNVRMADMLGYSVEEMSGRSVADFMFEEDVPDHLKKMENRRQGLSESYERRFQRKDGQAVWVQVSATPIFNDTRQFNGAFAMFTDITDRKRAEVILRESEEALKVAQRIAHVGSWHMDLATNEVYWSPVLYEIYGLEPALSPPLYNESMKLFTPESWEKLSTSITQTIKNGIPYELELEAVRKDGGSRWMWARGEVVRDASGVPVRVRGVVMDITERKLGEKKIRESEQKFRSMTDTSPLAIYMSSGIEQKAEYINPTFTRLFGYTLEEVPTAAQWWPLAYPDETYRRQIEEEWQRKVEQAIKTRSEIEPMEVVVTCKDGSRRHILWGYISTGIQNWAFGLDLTERKRAENAIKEKEERLALATVKNGVGVWDWNLQTQEMIWDDSMYSLYHIRREDFSGTEEAWRASLHPDARLPTKAKPPKDGDAKSGV
jgi:PAS domain S-box-containing protein